MCTFGHYFQYISIKIRRIQSQQWANSEREPPIEKMTYPPIVIDDKSNNPSIQICVVFYEILFVRIDLPSVIAISPNPFCSQQNVTINICFLKQNINSNP